MPTSDKRGIVGQIPKSAMFMGWDDDDTDIKASGQMTQVERRDMTGYGGLTCESLNWTWPFLNWPFWSSRDYYTL